MLKKILIAVISIAIAAFVLYQWQAGKRAAILVDNLAGTAAAAGRWEHSGIKSDTNGNIYIRNVRFQPAGFTQGVSVDEIIVTVDPLFLLKAEHHELRNYLPAQMNIALTGVRLSEGGGEDFQRALVKRGYWPFVLGYLGAPGCGEDGSLAFSLDQWRAITQDQPVDYNLNFYYQHQGQGSIDFQVDIEAENLWLASWSGQLTSAVGRSGFAFEDLLVENLFYYHQDAGFNERRNHVCAEKYQGSFAAYRKNSAQTIQDLLRAQLEKELPEMLLNLYQRSLLPEAAAFAEIQLPHKEYLDELFSAPQKDFLARASMRVGLGEGNPVDVELQPVSYQKLDSDTVIEAYRQRIREEQRQAQANDKHDQASSKRASRQVIGGKTVRYVPVNDINQALGKKARILTTKGRVIHGVLKSVSGKQAVVEVRYLSGTARFNLPLGEIRSVSLQKVGQ